MSAPSGLSEADAAGPTQMNYEEAGDRWRGRTWLARVVRMMILLAPIAASFATSFLATKHFPPSEVGMNKWVWWVCVILASTLVLLVTEKIARRFLPLAALLRLSLVFPDEAPNRFKAAMRTGTSRQLQRRLEHLSDEDEEKSTGEYMLDMMALLADHDRLTRGHAERVRAYTDMMIQELGLTQDDADKLHWAALLHDMGKMQVPADILNKDGRPTDEEFEAIKSHPAAGMPYVAPLQDWLGDWLHAVDQHHERWDGRGYPAGLRAEEIHLSARIVGVADAYDVITSARSYKKPLPAEVARQEIADNAGAQFDPTVVRAFLNIGLGRLRLAAGPLAWLNTLPGLADSAIAPAAGSIVSGAATMGLAGLASVAGVWPADTPPPEPPPPVMAFEVEEEASTPLTADPVTLSLDQDADVTFAVSGSAGTTVTVTIVTDPQHGTAVLVGEPVVSGEDWSQQFAYTPDAGFVGADAFEVEACDADECTTVTIDLSVAPVPHPPEAGPDAIDLIAGEPETIPTSALLTNDVDPDGDVLRVSEVSGGRRLSAVLLGDAVVVDAQSEYEGTTSFSYIVCDPGDLCAVGTVEVTVTAPPTDRAPVVAADTVSGIEDVPDTILTTLLMANDADPEGGELTFGGVSARAGLTVSVSDGLVSYSPAPDRSGPATFAYTVCDPTDHCSAATVTVNLAPTPDAPVAIADTVSGSENTSASIRVSQLLGNDADPDGDALEVASIASFDGLTATLETDEVTYTPAADLVGDASFQYTACDETERCDSATVTVTLAATNSAPVAVDDAGFGFVTPEDTAFVTDDILANDSDDDDPLDPTSIAITSAPRNGVAVSNGDGTFTYTPDPDFFGADTIGYTITDPHGATSNAATVTLGIASVNDDPVAVADSGSGFTTSEETSFTTADVTANDSDVDDVVDPSTVALLSTPTDGVIVNNGDGTFTYAPDPDFFGTDSFAYNVEDSTGAVSWPALVTITVVNVNDAPVAVDDSGPAFSTSEDTPFVTGDVSANDTDVDSPIVAANVELGTPPGSGTAVHNGDGTFTYTPIGGFSGNDTFTYTAKDPAGAVSNAGLVTITVSGVNDEPSFTAGGNATVLEDAGASTVSSWATAISAGPPEESAQILTFTVTNDNNALFTTQPAVNATTGDLTFTPAANANGTANVDITLTDNGGTANGGDDTSPTQTITITITAVNDEPTFTTGTNITVLEDASAQTNAGWATAISAGPTDESAQTLAFTVTNNNNALFTTQPDIDPATGDLTFTPAANANGTANVDITLTDNGGTANGGDDTSPTQTITITVSGVNDEPSFTAGGNATVLEDAGASTVSSWATAISAGPPEESAQILTFTVTNDNNALFTTQPAVNATTGDLTFTPAANANGTANVDITLTDNGGTANGGDDTSPTQTITITITAVNDEPTFTAGTNISVPQNAGAQTSSGWATAISAGPTDESAQTLTFTVTNNNNALFTTQPDIDPATGDLTFTPAIGAYGTANVDITLTDNGGTANGGDDTSPTQTITITTTPVDFDAIPAGSDNCPNVFNPDQLDTDGDGTGDACDTSPTVATTGTYTDSGQTLGGTATSRFVVLGDIDGDGDLDAVYANDAQASTVWTNDGSGALTDTGQSLANTQAVGAALGDVDGDGDLDLVFAHNGLNASTAWRNDGTGVYTYVGSFIGTVAAEDVAFGDFNGDDDLDLVFAQDGANHVWFGTGSGTFVFSGQFLGSGQSEGVDVGDLDGDGDLDLAFANRDSADKIYVNDGSGSFTDSGQSLPATRSHEVELGDLDGDGDLDIAIAADNDPSTVWLNNGSGTFTDSGQSLGPLHYEHMALGDIDGDGDLDAVYGDHTGANTVFTNNGSGTFTDSGQTLGSSDTKGLALGDLDGDGDLDAAFANDGDPNTVFLNN